MTPRYPTAEVLFYTSRTLRPVHMNMSLADLCTPDAVEDELARGRQTDSSRVLATVAGLDELPQVVPMAILLDGKDIRKN